MLVEKFQAYLKAHKSKTAQEKYVQGARAFLVYLQLTKQTPTTMKGGAIRDFVTWMITPEPGAKLPSAASVRLMVAGVRSYLNFLRGEDVKIPEQARPERPRLPQPLPIVMSREQLVLYQSCCFADQEPTQTAMLILPYCGLRVEELCQLRIRDVLWQDFSETDRRYILNVEDGKGHKQRLAPMFTGPSGLISKAFTHYLAEERPAYKLDAEYPKGDRWLFPIPLGRMLSPINQRMLQNRAVRYRPKVGLPELHPHLCRAHYATALLSIPLDVIEVAKYLGHTSNIDTLAKHYAGVRMDDVGEWMGVIARPTQKQLQYARRIGAEADAGQQQPATT